MRRAVDNFWFCGYFPSQRTGTGKNAVGTLTLTDSMKKNIERLTGLSIEDISRKTPEELDAHLAGKVGRSRLEVAPPRGRYPIGRGSVLLQRLSDSAKVAKELVRLR
jgi:hypothetical protein